MQIRNQKLTEKEFFKEREEVLKTWVTGKDVEDINDGVRYQKQIPTEKRFSTKLKNAIEQKITLVQPRAGVALIDAHIELLRYLEEEGGADLLPSTIDSYTRLNRYQDAEHGIKESILQNKSMLNGFPGVNHGVIGSRRVTESVKSPVQVRHGTPDARLLAEITLAGGFTSYEGGGISYNIPYAKNVSMEHTIKTWQYVDRLIGYYEENGVRINREPFGPLTGTLVPPCISNSVAVIEALLAAEQGVRDLTLGYGQCGNLIQDVAAIHSLREMSGKYLKKFGYNDCVVSTVLHQWMGGFPQDEAKAFGVICWGSAVAALSKATKVIVKTPHEAMGVPTKEANAAGLRATKQVISMLQDQQFIRDEALSLEIEQINKETEAIVERTLALGDGDLAIGTVRAFEAGVIDIPFAPSKYNQGKMLPARDHYGAVRFLNVGNIPFDEDIIRFHREKMEERGKNEHRDVSFNMVVDDIFAISNGNLVGRPTAK